MLSKNTNIHHNNFKFTWNLFFQLLLITAFIFGIESISYFVIGEYVGRVYGLKNTIDLQLPVDRLIPWATWMYPYYMAWPFIWCLFIPLLIYFSSGKKQFYHYVINSIFMYAIGSIIYIILPTTCMPSQFIQSDTAHPDWGSNINYVSNYNLLKPGTLFYSNLYDLASNSDNIWGSFPSYHNYWAFLLIFFGLYKGVKWYYRYPMIIIGGLITISTLMLHQHNIADVLLTYTLGIIFFIVDMYFGLFIKIENFLNKLFRIKNVK